VEAHYGRVVEAHQSLFGNTDPTNSNRIMRKLKSKIQDCEVKDSAEVAEIFRQTDVIKPAILPVGKKVRRYILSSCQDETKPDHAFVRNLEAYAEWLGDCEIMLSGFTYNKSGLEDVERRKSGKKDQPSIYHKSLRKYLNNGQSRLCDGLLFCGEMNTLPTAVRPLSGFETYTGGDWGIFPHPKIQLEAIATSKFERTKHLMTTGCVTKPNYVKKKAGIKAAFHHEIAAVLVEVDVDGSYFCRHLCADKHGSFYDLDRWIKQGEVTTGHRIEALNPGDIHHEKLDPDVALSVFGYDVKTRTITTRDNLIDWLRPKFTFLHDLSDFSARNHHNIKDPHFLYQTHSTQTANVEYELQGCSDFCSVNRRPFMELKVIQSNHDNALLRWLKSVDWRDDMENAKFYLQTQLDCLKLIDSSNGTPIFEKVLRDLSSDGLAGIQFIGEDDSFVICDDIECGMHGHLGANGSRGNLKQFTKFGRKSTTGHSHSAGWFDGALAAGVCSSLDLIYNKGASSWSHSNVLTYANGKRTIVTEMNGRWCIR
ncbi:hypothetical protein, partial [Parasphingorhabdus sp.]